MIAVIQIVQYILAGLLIAIILIQQKGSGLGAAFGGSNAIYTTRRGIDAILFKATIVISVLFFAVALLRVIL